MRDEYTIQLVSNEQQCFNRGHIVIWLEPQLRPRSASMYLGLQPRQQPSSSSNRPRCWAQQTCCWAQQTCFHTRHTFTSRRQRMSHEAHKHKRLRALVREIARLVHCKHVCDRPCQHALPTPTAPEPCRRGGDRRGNRAARGSPSPAWRSGGY